jgi:hypothetical protein
VPAKYLQHFPKPVLQDLVTGRWLPIVGAGMSLNARVPSGKRPPLWAELGKRLEEDLEDFTSTGPIDSVSAYEHEFGRARLIERLSEILLLREAQPGDAHREFCSIPFDIVCTTNFDFLLEKQYDLTPRYVYPVVEEEQLSLSASTAGTLLLKLHGDIHHPNRLVATEADYDGFLATYPLLATYLSNLLITKTAILIGYSLDDPDFRQLWHVVSQRLGRTRRPAYSIAIGAKQSDISRFERRGVNVINLPGSRERYGEILAAAFSELREHLREKVLSVSTVTEEKPLRELLLPRDAATRLCFFSLPLELLPFYRERVFPAVEEAGLVPVTADDVVAPGDSVSAKIDALIDRAVVMVVELSSAWTLAELRMAIARLKNRPSESARKHFQLIIVTTTPQQVPPEAAEFPVVFRQETWVAESDVFVNALVELLRRTAPSTDTSRGAEARRLLSAREYRASVIAAMTHLEASLRERLDKRPWQDVRRPFSLRSLVDHAVERNLVLATDRSKIDRWIRTRNAAVHTPQAVTARDARDVVEGVERILAEAG